MGMALGLNQDCNLFFPLLSLYKDICKKGLRHLTCSTATHPSDSFKLCCCEQQRAPTCQLNHCAGQCTWFSSSCKQMAGRLPATESEFHESASLLDRQKDIECSGNTN
eukprot:764025-Hanusia_phi.AAC.3